VPRSDPDEANATLIDGTIGELSPFHSTLGCTHTASVNARRLSDGWRDRLILLCSDNTAGVTGWCLDPHDLGVAKLVAGRPHDLEFCRRCYARLLEPGMLAERLAATELRDDERAVIVDRLDALVRGTTAR